MRKFIILVLLFCTPNLLSAKTLVFIHGYMAGGMSWRNNGVTLPLIQQGWVDGGALTMNKSGTIRKYPATRVPLQHDVFYSIELPWTRSIAEQSQVLARYIKLISVARQQTVSLVGHSIGGVVSRHYLVSKSPIDPFSGIGQVKSLKHSRQLLRELTPEKPNTYLYWLNHQPHPTISYLSIIRKNDKLKFHKFDYAVPTYSQDMNKVFALKDRSARYLSNGGHSLNQTDGWIIAEFLQNVK